MGLAVVDVLELLVVRGKEIVINVVDRSGERFADFRGLAIAAIVGKLIRFALAPLGGGFEVKS